MLRILTILTVSVIIITYLFLVMDPQRQEQGKALIGGDFSLTSTDGTQVTNDSLKGMPRLVYFGFTYCPDICPAGLLTISAALEQLEPKLGDETPRAIFISVDPERDTVEQLGGYVENFPGVLGLTGSVEEVDQAAKAYRVYYRKVQNEESSDYLIDHSGYIYLMDEEGEYLAHFPHSVSVEALVSGVLKALNER